jgi:protein-tyrosine phosphatase
VTLTPTRGWGLLFLYPAVSFARLAVAYSGVGPRLLGKRADGGRRWWARLLFAPYLLLTRFSFLLYKLLGRHTAACEVVPNLFLGRRLTAQEAERFADVSVLDLAAEFGEARPLRTPDRYRSLPVLDATAPTCEQFTLAVRWIAEQLPHRPVFVHCALGHGRSASVVIAYLLHSGQVPTVRDGLRRVRGVRFGVGLSASQRRGLEGWWATRNPTPVA